MARVKNNFQDTFLNQAKRDKVPVVIYLVNGYKLQGIIKGFDNFTLFLSDVGKLQMVYKHAITTVSPLKSIRMNFQPLQLEKPVTDEEVI